MKRLKKSFSDVRRSIYKTTTSKKSNFWEQIFFMNLWCRQRPFVGSKEEVIDVASQPIAPNLEKLNITEANL